MTKSTQFECLLCGSKVECFYPFGMNPLAQLRPNALCPVCKSLERHRAIWLYFKEKTNLFKDNLKMLHVAPEHLMSEKIRTLSNVDYLSADLYSPAAMVKMDITDIQFPDDSFDVIYASHVLEHIPDDLKAMSELCRVLKPSGWAILQVPMWGEKTLENPNITTPEEREKNFGQKDHVRLYGFDGVFKERLEKAGFDVTVDTYVRTLNKENIKRYGLVPNEDIYICKKKSKKHDKNFDSCTEEKSHHEMSYWRNGKDLTSPPSISIIIPVYNAQPTLGMCLESVNKIDYPNDKYEVIVVDNGSTDASVDIAKKNGAKVLFENSIKSSYAARNKGITEAKGDLIAFTDSDCIVTPEWLKYLVQDWEDETIGCFAGEIEAYQPVTLVERFSDRMGILRQKGTLNCSYLPYTQTANSAYRKDVFEKIGLFIPEMISGGDGEISWRMQKKLGLKIKFIPEALVYHKHRTSLLGLYRQFKKYEKGKFFFKKYYPDYNLPPFNQRQEELNAAIEKVKLSFLSDFKKYIEGKIDLVHFATPFLMLIIRCGVYAAWVEKETGYEKGAMFENLDLEKFVLRIQEIISELEPTELLYASGETGEKVQILAERNKRLAEQLAEKSSQLEEKERYIRSLLDSRSWKITAPLRKIMGVLTK